MTSSIVNPINNNSKIKELQSLLNSENLEDLNNLILKNDSITSKLNKLYENLTIKSIFPTFEDFIQIMQEMETIKLNEEEGEVEILVEDSFCMFSLINVPQKMAKEDILAFLTLSTNEIERIYKKSIFWIIITKFNETEEKIEKILKTQKIVNFSKKG